MPQVERESRWAQRPEQVQRLMMVAEVVRQAAECREHRHRRWWRQRQQQRQRRRRRQGFDPVVRALVAVVADGLQANRMAIYRVLQFQRVPEADGLDHRHHRHRQGGSWHHEQPFRRAPRLALLLGWRSSALVLAVAMKPRRRRRLHHLHRSRRLPTANRQDSSRPIRHRAAKRVNYPVDLV